MVMVVVSCFAFLSHNRIVLFSTYRQVALMILGIVAVGLVLVETQSRNKVMFSLFVLLGMQQILDLLYNFVPIIFPENRFAGHSYFQYVTSGLGLFIQSTCLAGCAVLMNSRIRTWLAMSLVSVSFAVVFVMEFHPLLLNSRYLYTTPDITDFRIIDRAWTEVYQTNRGKVTPEAVAGRIGLSRWEKGKRTGELSYEEAIRRVEEIEPYLFGNNYNMLIYQPLNGLWWQTSAFTGVVILLTLLNWFLGGSPSGVYFERISVIVLSFSIFEVFHFHTYTNLASYSNYLDYFNIGALLSLLTVVILVLVFFLRLRFLLSHEGQYYESRLARGSAYIARWRDGFDNYVIQKLFGRNPFRARFLIKFPRR